MVKSFLESWVRFSPTPVVSFFLPWDFYMYNIVVTTYPFGAAGPSPEDSRPFCFCLFVCLFVCLSVSFFYFFFACLFVSGFCVFLFFFIMGFLHYMY